MSSIAFYLSRFGTVISPDLPGIGGMDSFYKVGRKFSIDNYAELLFEILKKEKIDQKKQEVVLAGMSFGFIVSTRMLQLHPEAARWFSKVMCIGAFGRWSDFQRNLPRDRVLRYAKIGNSAVGSFIIKTLFMRDWPLKLYFWFLRFRKNVKYDKKGQAYRDLVEMELSLWKENDTRTRFAIYKLFCTFDLTKPKTEKIKTHVYSLFIPADQWVNAKRVHKTLRKLYKSVDEIPLDSKVHAPSVISSESEIEDMFGDSIAKVLSA